MEKKLNNKLVAILVTDGYEQSELEEPRKALLDNGAEVHVISPAGKTVRSWSDRNWSEEIEADRLLEEITADEYDALLLPGGVINPDKLRKDPASVEFVKKFVMAGKPVAAICHGPWTLIEAGAVKGKTLTSYDSIKTDLINAGAKWVNEEVVVDGSLVTSRSPKDLPAFNSKIVEVFSTAKQVKENSF
jgi:protease I